MVEYSFMSTMYNNANRLKLCLDSVLAALTGLDFEIIIVDNYSTDGSLEILKEYARLNNNIKILRCKCARGLGRQIAFKNSKGKYVVTIDTDTEYQTEKLRNFLLAHNQNKTNPYVVKTWGSFVVYPRHLLEEVGGWRKYNMSEDMDLLARLFLKHMAVFVPINLEFNEDYIEGEEKETPLKILETFHREHRYAKGLTLLKRLVQNKIDFFCANAYTVRKTIVHHRFLRMKLFATIFVCFQVIASKIVNTFWRNPITNSDPVLANSIFVFYQSIQNLVDPSEFGLNIEPAPDFLDEPFRFLSTLKPRLNEKMKRLNSRKA